MEMPRLWLTRQIESAHNVHCLDVDFADDFSWAATDSFLSNGVANLGLLRMRVAA